MSRIISLFLLPLDSPPQPWQAQRRVSPRRGPIPLFDEARLRALGALSLPALLIEDAPPTTFVVDGLLADGSVNIIVGDSGIGKSPLLIQLGLSVAAGVEFCDIPTLQGPVLYVDCENGKESFQEIARNLIIHMGLGGPPPAFTVYSPNWDPRPDANPEVLLTLHDLVAALRPRLIVVDPLRMIWPRAEGKNEEAVAMVQFQRKLSRDYGGAWVNIHHCRKPSQDAAARQNAPALASHPHEWLLEAAGARALVNQMDTRIGIVRANDLTMAGFTRMLGVIPTCSFRRLRHLQTGVPVGYTIVRGLEAISSSQAIFFEGLPLAFTWGEAEHFWRARHDGKLNSSKLSETLEALVAARLLRRIGQRKGYEKALSALESTVGIL